MYSFLYFILFLLFCYALGCISTGYYLVKFFASIDIKSIGSKSTGATNVGRILGKKWFFITVIIDILKGFLIAMLCKYFMYNDVQSLLYLIALVFGHIWPIQLKFHGGKGIAVLLSFIFLWNFYMFIGFTIILLVLYLILKNFTISGLISLVFFPIFSLFNHFDFKTALLLNLLIVIIYYAHRENIKEFYNLKMKRK